MDKAALIENILTLEPWTEVELSADRRTRSVKVDQNAEAVMAALACDEYTRAVGVKIQRREGSAVIIDFTWYD